MTRDFMLTLVADLSDALAGQHLVSASVGPAGEAIVLAVDGADVPVVTGYWEQPGWASFPHSQTQRPYAGSVLVHDGRSLRHTTLHDLQLAHPLLQPLPGGEVLVVGARCRRLPDGTAERNALVYGADGPLNREIVFGDGVEDVQATRTGSIWVSYFDEGVFGNYGWGHGPDSAPIGGSGLVRFDAQGARLWAFRPPDGMEPIADCYALNVDDEAAWACYYTDFPLVHIASDDHVEAWQTDVAGPRALAVGGGRVLFFGGYPPESQRCVLAELGSGTLRNLATGRLLLPSGEPVVDDRFGDVRAVGRGPFLHLFVGTGWYRLDVRDLP